MSGSNAECRQIENVRQHGPVTVVNFYRISSDVRERNCRIIPNRIWDFTL